MFRLALPSLTPLLTPSSISVGRFTGSSARSPEILSPSVRCWTRMHVGMNIADKARLFTEVFRVLKPGAAFGVYDVMRNAEGDLTYPVPWATEQTTSALATPNHYKQAMSDAGFRVSAENPRRDFALNFFKDLKAKTEANGGPPPLGLHTLMQESTPIKLKNMIDAITANLVAPVEIIARKE